MRRTLIGLLVGVVLGSILGAGPAAAEGGPEVGLSAGVMVPMSDYKRSVDGVGGAFSLLGGYRFVLSDQTHLSLVAEPTFVFMGSDACCGDADDDTAGLFIGSAGPKLTIAGDPIEATFTIQGGYYRDMMGPISDEGPGINGGLGIGYRFARATSAGVFGRYHWADMDETPASDDGQRRFLIAGLSFTHAFLPPEPIAAPPPPPPPPPPAPKRRIVLRGVNFDFDKATIRPDAVPILDEAVRTLQAEPAIAITVEGHTDAVGTDRYNQGLSERRARAVADYLAAGGIDASRMTIEGYGESKPVASNDTRDGRAQNRRVELRIAGQ